MPIEDVFSISGRGTVVTGRVDRGQGEGRRGSRDCGVQADDEEGGDRAWRCSASCWTRAWRGTTSGCCCGASRKTDVERGQVLAKPGSITPHTKFKGEVYILSKEEGGRHTPFFNGYRPQFYIRTTDVTGIAASAGGRGDGDAGGQHADHGELITPVALEKGARFAIREGGRTVGAGTITEISSRVRLQARTPVHGSLSLSLKPDKDSAMRDIVTLACADCKRRNYSTTKNKKKTTERLEFSKYCRFCRKHTAHQRDEVGQCQVASAVRRASWQSRDSATTCNRQPKRLRRPIAQLVEHRSPKPGVGGSSPSWPASCEARSSGAGIGSGAA